MLLVSSPLDYNPTPTPLSGNWQNVSCSDPVIQNRSLDVTTRWNYADANGAWDAAVKAWNQTLPSNTSFSQFITDFFGGPQTFECGSTYEQSYCSGSLMCTEVPTVAAQYILNSLSMINNVSFSINPNGRVINF